MELRKIVGILVSCVVIAGGFFLMRRQHGPQKPVVAIVQIASHPALDAARSGFIDAFTAGLGNGYTFLVKNADGSVANAQTIAQSVTSRTDVVAFLALGTPAAQALVQKEMTRPVFFTAVTYPEKSGLSQNNVAGISDYFDLSDLVNFAHIVAPQALRVGILYNPGSEVASKEFQEIEQACKQAGLVSVKITGVTETDILGAFKSNLRKIDMCLASTDNTIASAMSALAAMSKDAGIPLIVADKTLVASGPVAGLGMDYYQLGFDLGRGATRVFLGECTPAEIGIVHAAPSAALNQTTYDALMKSSRVLGARDVLLGR